MPTLRLGLLPAVLAAGALSATVVTFAPASRAPSAPARTAIAAAVHGSSLGGLDRIPERDYRVTGARISSGGSSWASAGCGIAPDKVLADLDHVRRPCRTGGID